MLRTNLKIKSYDPTGTPTVRQLIEMLQQCQNQDAPVLIWLLEADEDSVPYHYDATGRYAIESVDDTFENHYMVDINVCGLA